MRTFHPVYQVRRLPRGRDRRMVDVAGLSRRTERQAADRAPAPDQPARVVFGSTTGTEYDDQDAVEGGFQIHQSMIDLNIDMSSYPLLNTWKQGLRYEFCNREAERMLILWYLFFLGQYLIS